MTGSVSSHLDMPDVGGRRSGRPQGILDTAEGALRKRGLPQEGDRVLAANIALKYQKCQRNTDAQKTVSLRLLPTIMTLHDSLRLLVIALVDGVFGAGITWADLLAIDPGTLISVSVVRSSTPVETNVQPSQT
jgi:hypothetical protein